MLTERMVYLINSKAKDINEKPHRHYKYASKQIKTLDEYIVGQRQLSDMNIENKLLNLLQSTIFLDIPLPVGTSILRARKYNEKNNIPCFETASELSYNSDKKLVKLNRMNKKEEPMFYGTLSKDNNNIGTIFSEINAVVGNTVCVLKSGIAKELLVRPIGIFSYYSNDLEPPIELHPIFKEMYQYFKKTFSKKGMEVVNKCDIFFARILKEKGTERLYKVTSILATLCLEGTTDGIIYPSVKGKDAPNLVIKPSSIIAKIQYEEVSSFFITEKFENTLYQADNIYQANIVNNEIIHRKLK